MKIFIGCSSSSDIPSEYIEDCKKMLDELFKRGYSLVFGACKSGLMGVSYEMASKYRRDIVGIFPEIYKDEMDLVGYKGISVSSIADRTDMVIDESDVLIFLPGGFGTIYELFTAIECIRSKEKDKVIIIYNSCGYFDKLLDFIDLLYEEKFATNSVRDCYCICNNSLELFDCLNSFVNKD